MDKDGDGSLSPSEVSNIFQELFRAKGLALLTKVSDRASVKAVHASHIAIPCHDTVL